MLSWSWARIVWFGSCVMAWLVACVSVGCSAPTPKPTVPSSLVTPQSRSCPDLLAGTGAQSSFATQTKPCAETLNIRECTDTCKPKNIPASLVTAPSGFFSDCAKAEVLCVGKGREVETLAAMAKKVAQDKAIVRVLIASAQYSETVTLENLQQALVIEGESNDPSKGVRIEAPASTSASADYAAVRLKNVTSVTLKNLVLKGKGHGLFVTGGQSIIVDGNHLTSNERTGATFQKVQKLEILRTFVRLNGGLKGQGKLAVSQLYPGLVVEQSPAVTVKDSLFEQNGSGGLQISSSPVSIIVDGNHRVPGHATAGIIVDGNHRVVLEGNVFDQNGPVSFAGLSSQATCSSACPSGSYCEGGACVPVLLAPLPQVSADAFGVVGFGALVAGVGTLSVTGNRFFRNDTAGLLAHSIQTVTLRENVLSRNGARRSATTFDLKTYAYAAAHIWNLTNSLSSQFNVVVDNATTGIQLSHQSSGGNAPGIQSLVESNHLSGNGRFLLSSNNPVGDGFRVSATQGGSGVALTFKGNFFTRNGRAALYSTGAVRGTIEANRFDNHPFRALVFHDTGASSTNSIIVDGNHITGALGYGIQAHTGAASLTIQNNLIQNLQPPSGGQEADAINLTNLTGSSIQIFGNILRDSRRSGVFLDNTTATLQNNAITNSQFSVVTQQNAQVQGNTSNASFTPISPLPNRKDF